MSHFPHQFEDRKVSAQSLQGDPPGAKRKCATEFFLSWLRHENLAAARHAGNPAATTTVLPKKSPPSAFALPVCRPILAGTGTPEIPRRRSAE